MSCLLHKCKHIHSTLLQSQQTRTFAVYKKTDIKISVTLESDYTSLGYAGQIVQVPRGYARNYLIPRQIANYTYIKTPDQMNHKKQLNVRTDTATDTTANTTTTAVTAEVEQRRFNELLRSKLSRCIIKCSKKPTTAEGNDITDRAGDTFIGDSINSLYVYSKIIKLYPDISTQLYSDRITLTNGDITTFGQHTAQIQLYPAAQDQAIDIQIHVKPNAL